MTNDSEFMIVMSLLFLRSRWEPRKQISFNDNVAVKYIMIKTMVLLLPFDETECC